MDSFVALLRLWAIGWLSAPVGAWTQREEQL
jgi:hypothetical protein